MRTTLEIPDKLFREAKATAAKKGITLKALITRAIERELQRESGFKHSGEPEWLRMARDFSRDPDMVKEIRRIQETIDEEFSKVEEDAWP